MTSQASPKPTVLLITPYSPLNEHDHAANDLARPFVTAVSKLVDLHVYASDGADEGWVSLEGETGATFHAATERAARRRWQRLSPFPFASRSDWQRSNTDEVLRLVTSLRPDVLHCEYFQPTEVLHHRVRSLRSATVHDVMTPIARVQARRSSGPRKLLALGEFVKVRRAERRLFRSLDHVFVFSDRDAEAIGDSGPPSSLVHLGVAVPDAVCWRPTAEPVGLFAGALWRTPNQEAALFLATEVWPLVRSRVPQARLRIVGSRPPDFIRALGSLDGVEVEADVPDLDVEYTSASVNLAPSMVPAGVLLKALRAMALGCPVVLNTHSAAGLPGLVDERHALVRDGAASTASAVAELFLSPDQGAALGAAAQSLVRDRFSWSACASTYAGVWQALVAQEK